MANTTGRGASERIISGVKAPFDGEPEQNVSVLHRFRQGPQRRLLGKALLVGIHALLAALVNDALGVAHGHVFALRTQRDVVLGAGDARRPGAIDDDFTWSMRLPTISRALTAQRRR